MNIVSSGDVSWQAGRSYLDGVPPVKKALLRGKGELRFEGDCFAEAGILVLLGLV